MGKKNFLDFYKPETLGQWIVFLAAIGITLSSPAGTARFLRELEKYISGKQKNSSEYKSHNLSQALYYLKKREIIKISEKNGKTIIELTEKGKKRKLQYDLENMTIEKPEKWDGKWRFLMFDIPEFTRVGRSMLREKVKELGFYQFQKSVWVYPYPCDEQVDFLVENFSVGQYVNLLTVKVEDDRIFREFFKLS